MAISNMLPQIWSARILAKLEKNLVFAQPGVVNRDYEGDIRADGDRVHIHSFNDLTVSSYTKNSTTITYENLTDSRGTLVIDQSKYFAFSVDDIDTAQMRPELIDAAADRAAYQLAEVADSYIAGLYSGASTSSPDNTIETCSSPRRTCIRSSSTWPSSWTRSTFLRMGATSSFRLGSRGSCFRTRRSLQPRSLMPS